MTEPHRRVEASWFRSRGGRRYGLEFAAIVVLKPGAELTREAMLAFYDGKIAKWWAPDDVQFVEAIPLGATGKILKTRLREQFAEYRLPEG